MLGLEKRPPVNNPLPRSRSEQGPRSVKAARLGPNRQTGSESTYFLGADQDLYQRYPLKKEKELGQATLDPPARPLFEFWSGCNQAGRSNSLRSSTKGCRSRNKKKIKVKSQFESYNDNESFMAMLVIYHPMNYTQQVMAFALGGVSILATGWYAEMLRFCYILAGSVVNCTWSLDALSDPLTSSSMRSHASLLGLFNCRINLARKRSCSSSVLYIVNYVFCSVFHSIAACWECDALFPATLLSYGALDTSYVLPRRLHSKLHLARPRSFDLPRLDPAGGLREGAAIPYISKEDSIRLEKHFVGSSSGELIALFREYLPFPIGIWKQIFLLYTGTWDPIDEDMVSLDPLAFHSEEEPYKDRIDSYQRKTGLTEAVQTGTGQLNGIPVCVLPEERACKKDLKEMQMAKISSALYDYQSNQK
ncbi:acetyl-coenzyme A carboxylase carboxyltransferase subunit beta [Striga asiatica]|uniref:Acetyl-coenzyme A carboxylase carboxyltransferase subunit beta n=1 Tax=Striga asiatica TaxID=4170 RepID=A0A5A7QL50_STRAF|nr:acetyl-coenzyme A carboxylase carboxyltransferase subunit beta [Striga asiatica]